jgi:hypothetical protein
MKKPAMITLTVDADQLQMLLDGVDILSPDSDDARETQAALLEYLSSHQEE